METGTYKPLVTSSNSVADTELLISSIIEQGIRQNIITI